jgi:hypothetical protein
MRVLTLSNASTRRVNARAMTATSQPMIRMPIADQRQRGAQRVEAT